MNNESGIIDENDYSDVIDLTEETGETTFEEITFVRAPVVQVNIYKTTQFIPLIRSREGIYYRPLEKSLEFLMNVQAEKPRAGYVFDNYTLEANFDSKGQPLELYILAEAMPDGNLLYMHNQQHRQNSSKNSSSFIYFDMEAKQKNELFISWFAS